MPCRFDQMVSKSQLDSFLDATLNGGKVHPTAIVFRDAGGKPQVRLTYDPIADPKPFHRWNWLVAKSEDLAEAVSKLKISDKPHLKYRVVHKSSYTDASGARITCAVVFR